MGPWSSAASLKGALPDPGRDSVPVVRALKHGGDLLSLHARQPGRYPCLLESVLQGSAQARYDILFAFPGETLQLDNGLHLNRPGSGAEAHDFLHQFDAWWRAHRTMASATCSLPFQGGWFVYLGYELAGQIEPALQLPLFSRSAGLPTAYALRVPAAIIRDHRDGRIHLLAETGHEKLLDLMAEDISRGSVELPVEAGSCLSGTLEEENPEIYLNGIRRIKDYIVEGDIFQVNLSRSWQGRLCHDISDMSLYQRLRQSNPAPFAALCRLDSAAVISSSPERLVSVRGDIVETRPIAGTVPRLGGSAYDGGLLEKQLRRHPKERAEHIMLIDLERNDLGRICLPGSIQVTELLALESYAYVHHLVSNVRGRLRPALAPGDIIRAVFPGGTITGCPKVRCMEIIAELEQKPRGAYTGAVGYINRDGSMDLNILIRTMVRSARDIVLNAGAGIVADSDPQRELEETRAKAHGLLRALC